jgi:hypothetical protein
MKKFNKEVWEIIENCNEYYQVSTKGRVKSPYKILTPCNMLGYLSVHLRKCTTQKTPKIHRLVAIAFIPNPLNLPEVNHLDGNKKNNNDWNLEWSSSKNNTDHAIKTGLRDSIGEANGRAVLTETQVKEIRLKHIPRIYGQVRLAKEYGVSQRQIGRIIHNQQWT